MLFYIKYLTCNDDYLYEDTIIESYIINYKKGTL